MAADPVASGVLLPGRVEDVRTKAEGAGLPAQTRLDFIDPARRLDLL